MTPTQTTGIAPYWTLFPSFFRYPLRAEALVVCCGLALLAGFGEMLGGVIGFFCTLVLFLASVRYGFYVLERTALGHIEDRLVLFDGGRSGQYLPFMQLLFYLVAAMLAGIAAALLGPGGGALMLALCGLAWPANTMILAVRQDLGESLTPSRLWLLASNIGMPYLGLCGCLLLLGFGSAAVQALTIRHMPGVLHGMLGGFVWCYFTVVMYRLMGYVLYQYHEELGVDVRVHFDQQPTVQSTAPDPRAARALQAARIASLLREGRGDEALAEASASQRQNPHDPETNERLHRLLSALPGQAEALQQHARSWLPVLLRARRDSQAVEVVLTVRRRVPGFAPGDANDLVPLARAAFEAHQYALATDLIRGFDQKHPGHADTPAAYLLGARLLVEHHRDEAQAERVLTAIRARFPEHPVSVEAAQLLQVIERLRKATG